MTTLEKEIEAKLRKMVRSRGGWCLKWVSPGNAGVPDRICLLPGRRIYFVETKKPKGGVLSARQKWWRQVLQTLGFFYTVAWTFEDIKNLELIIITEEAALQCD